MDISKIPFSGASDNFTKGRNHQKISAFVIHVMAGSEVGTRVWFNNPGSDVSAHFGVSSTGEVEMFVRPEDTAWHAGSWDWNLKTIGIEHEGRPPGWCPTDSQIKASVDLVASLCLQFGVVPSEETIIPHVRINPLHSCPSSGFPLADYIKAVRDRVARQTGATPPPAVTEDRHEPELIEYRLFDGDMQVGLVSVVRGTDKAYLKSTTRAVATRTGRPTAESYGASRLFDPRSNLQIGTLSLVLGGSNKAYINALYKPL